MRAGFAGTPEFAVRALGAIDAAGIAIPVVLTQPDRPAGRGMRVSASPVKRFAESRSLRVLQPAGLRDAVTLQDLQRIDVDVLVVAAYGLILPQAVLDWPRYGCINIHASLLPRWRGAAPIARAVEAGDAVTGITIMQMEAGLDTGPIIARKEVPIGARETAGDVERKLAEIGGGLIVAVLQALARGEAPSATPQPEIGVTYAEKVTRADRIVDWEARAEVIDRKVRALTPAPGAVTSWRGTSVRIVNAEPLTGQIDDDARPGAVVAVGLQGVDVRCGVGTCLRLTSLQPSGGRAMAAHAFAVGRGIARGQRFEVAV